MNAKNLQKHGVSRSPAIWAVLTVAVASWLTACGSLGGRVGVGVPVGPLSVGVGLGSGGVSAGIGAGAGPLGVGVGVNQRGQVTGSAGVGASTGVGGGARVGVGVGSSTVLHDPNAPKRAVSREPEPGVGVPAAQMPRMGSGDASGIQWRDASGQRVPECRVNGGC